MIRIVTALIVLVALNGEATAQADAARPRLRELVTVSSEIVRIGDLVDNAGASAEVPVFRAPDLGQTGSVPLSRIAEALRPHDIAGLDTAGLSEVIVTRLSRPISQKDISERITRALAGQFGYGDAQNLSVILDREVRLLHVESGAVSDLAVARLSADPRNGRFDILFELPGSAVARRLPLRFTGTATETVEVATLTRVLRQGEVIKASDVTTERRPKAEAGGDGIYAAQAVGMALKNPARIGQALRNNDLVKPQLVQRNEPVMLTFEVPGIMLTVRGKATEAGALGDVISVVNVQSNRTIHAAVTGPGRATVISNAPIVAAAASPASDDQTSRSTQ